MLGGSATPGCAFGDLTFAKAVGEMDGDLERVRLRF
jgi:hypothetical protein